MATATPLVVEGDTGLTDVTFTVTRAGDATTPQSVRWAVRPDGGGPTAAAAEDFAGDVLPGGVLLFRQGETTHTVTVQVAGDTAAEQREGFAVVLLAPTNGATLGEARAVVAIVNDDAFIGGAGADTLTGGADDDRLLGGTGDDFLRGGGGNDTIEGGAGNDRLVGGGGSNVLLGGAGDDAYIVTSAGDTVVEAAEEGSDTVYASVGFTLPDHVELLFLAGSDAIDGTGNALDNRIFGGAGDNVLRGMAGDDMLIGGDGADTLLGGEGADQLGGGAGADVFAFARASESPRTGMDAIVGFVSGEDRIDLSAIGTGIDGWSEEAFVLGSAFTAARQVAWDAESGLLRIDTDGDLATAEMMIRLTGGASLAVTDLILA